MASKTLVLLILVSLPLATLAASKIRIEGIKDDVRKNVEAYLSIGDEPCDAPVWRIRARFERADKEITQALQAYGYYRSVIRTQLQMTENCWQATFNIEPGPRVSVGTVDLQIEGEAESDPEFNELRSETFIRPGEKLQQDHYEELKRTIESLAAKRGYLDGRFVAHELRVTPSKGIADIHLHYDSGTRFHFGTTQIDQNAVKRSIVRGLITYHEGDPYDSEEITKTSRALSNSGYFSQVKVRPQIDKAKDRNIPIAITLTPSKRRKYNVSLGFATDTGPRLRLGFEDRRINKRGHRFRSKLLLSKVESEFTAGLQIPLDNPRAEFLSFDSGYKRERTNSSRSETIKLGASRTYNRRYGWLEKRFLEAFDEDFTVAGESDKAKVLTPGVNWSKVVTDNPIFIRNGYRLFVEARGSLVGLLSDLSLLQMNVKAKGIIGLPWRTRLIARTDLGATWLENKFSTVPPSLRFFAGGDNSVRGYDYKSLGPENVLGDVIGGRNLLVGSLEIDHLVTQNWGIATFIDMGNAFNNTEITDLHAIELKTGVGIGLRWHSPIGPVRLDLAFALDKQHNKFQPHISMGPDL